MSLILQLTYLDRVEFKVRDNIRNFPILSNWTIESVKKRVKEELKEGGFGKGRIIDRLALIPVYKHLQQKTHQEEHQDNVIHDLIYSAEHTERHQEPHEQPHPKEGRKVILKYLMLINISFKKYISYTILNLFQ